MRMMEKRARLDGRLLSSNILKDYPFLPGQG